MRIGEYRLRHCPVHAWGTACPSLLHTFSNLSRADLYLGQTHPNADRTQSNLSPFDPRRSELMAAHFYPRPTRADPWRSWFNSTWFLPASPRIAQSKAGTPTNLSDRFQDRLD